MTSSVLKAFFSSETRIKVLAHFFLHPHKSYYSRQLEQLLSIPVSQISRELHSLENSGLFSSHFEGNQKRYILNRKFSLFEELRSIFLKTAGAVDHIRESFSQIEGIELAFIYGSFASGEERESSDIDLMAVGKVSEGRVHRELSGLEKKLGREVNYSLFGRDEVANRIRDNDNFITSVFKGKRIMVIGDEDDELFGITEE